MAALLCALAVIISMSALAATNFAQEDVPSTSGDPTISVTGESFAELGQPYQLDVSIDGVEPTEIAQWVISWGDGTTTTGTGQPGQTEHTYQHLGGAHSITVSVATTSGDVFSNSELTVSEYDRFGLPSVRAIGGERLDDADAEQDASLISAVVVGPDGLTYAIDETTNTILRINNDSAAPFVDAESTLQEPVALAFGNEGHLLVIDAIDGAIHHIDITTGETIRIFEGADQLLLPSALLVGPDGDLFITDALDDDIERFDGNTGAHLATFATFEAGAAPSALALGPDNTLLVALPGTDQIVAVSDTGDVSDIEVDVETPNDLTIGPDGALWVADYWNDQVLRFEIGTGDALDSDVPLAELAGPLALDFVPDISLVVITPGAEPPPAAAIAAEPAAEPIADPDTELNAKEWRETIDEDAEVDELVFVANEGEAEEELDFIAQADDYVAVIADNSIEVALDDAEPDETVTMVLEDAVEKAPSAASTDTRVAFDDVYDGIDAVYSDDDGELEYSFIIEAGGDPNDIVLNFEGDNTLRIIAEGDLYIDAATGPDLLSTAPFTFQFVDGEMKVVSSSYRLRSDGTVGFTLGDYDTSRPVVIDPTLTPATNLVMVTSGGDLSVTADAERSTFFTNLGYTVNVIAEGDSQTVFNNAATANDVMFITASAGTASVGTKAQGLDIGIITESNTVFGGLMYGGVSFDTTSASNLNVIDNSHYVTETLSTGSQTFYSPAQTDLAWDSSGQALPAGAQPLVQRSTNNESVIVIESGAALYSANTAPNRRVYLPTFDTPTSSWAAATDTVVERAAAWGTGQEYTDVLNVNSTADVVDQNPGNGSCDTGNTVGSDPECTLRAAIQESNALAGEQTIVVPAGTYNMTISGASEDLGATGDYDINADVTISGAGSALVTINAPVSDRLIESRSGSLTLSGVTLTGGNFGNPGAGIFVNSSADLTMSDVVITGNSTSSNGGGVYARGDVTASDSTISGNTAGGTGGGINTEAAATVTLTRVAVTGNGATGNGGGANVPGTLIVVDSLFEGNTSGGNGGGFRTVGAAGSANLTNVTVSGNDATGTGGGIDNGDTAVLVNSTIANNTAGTTGGIRNGGAITLRNTIVAGNSGGSNNDVQGTFSSAGNNIIGEDGTSTGWVGSDLLDTDPLLSPLADNGGPSQTHAIGLTSPALDAGTASSAPSADQRGTARPIDGDGDTTATHDIGAFEYDPGPGAGGNLVMVTGDGAFSGTSDTTKRSLFESWGWTVTAIDDQAAAGTFSTAAATNDVMFVSQTASGVGTNVRDLDIGLVTEAYQAWYRQLYAPADQIDFVDGTALSIVENSHPITTGFSLGSVTVQTAPSDLNFWQSDLTALPAGVTVLAEMPGSPNDDALLVADTGGALLNANTAANRRVWFPTDFSDPSVWTSDYETLLERSLDWAANIDAPATPTVTINSTGDSGDATPGDDVCDTGGTNSEGADECTLRAAIEELNASSLVNTIEFSIPTSDSGRSTSPLAYTITPTSGYDDIISQVTIDGTTQPDYGSDPIIQLDGSSAAGATAGLVLETDDSTIRGLIVHSFPDEGLEIDASTGGGQRNTLDGNWVGVDASGAANGNTDVGVLVTVGAADNTITGNVISSNGNSGLVIRNSGSTNNIVQSNIIGLAPDGTTPRPNASHGVEIYDNAASNMIGGTASNEGNTVASNSASGIVVQSTAGAGNSLLQNAVYTNVALGIDLANDGVTANSGADTWLNFPVITTLGESAGTVTVDFDVDVPAGNYRIEAFTNPAGPDPTGYGEGETFQTAQTITHTGSGAETFQLTYTGTTTDTVTLTTTEDLGGGNYGSTSEFSQAVAVTTIAVVNSTGDSSDAIPGDNLCDTGGTNSEGATECTLRAAIEEATASASIHTIHFNIPNSDPNHLYYQDDATADSFGAPVATTLDDGSIRDFDTDYPVSDFSWWNIQVTGNLPDVTTGTTIDGTTQPGWQPNTAVGGAARDAVLPIVISSDGFYIINMEGPGSTIRGINLSESSGGSGSGTMLYVDSSNSTVEGIWLMVDPVGLANGPGDDGIWVVTLTTNVTIGGPDPEDHVLIGNGGSNSGLTLISDNSTAENIWIGAAVTGNELLPFHNDIPLYVSGNDNVVRDVVVSNAVNDLLILQGDRNTVQGSAFGHLPDGTPSDGEYSNIDGNDNHVGGVNPGEGNTFRGGDANIESVLYVEGGAGNSVLGNTYTGARALNIDINPDGVNPNDAGDGDSGDNDLLNHPVVTLVTPAGATATVDYQLDVPAGTYRVEFYADDNEPRVPDGYGAGEVLVGTASITHTGSGVEAFSTSITDLGEYWLAATATEDLGGGDYGSTSEFGPTGCVGDTDGDGLCDGWEEQLGDTDGDTLGNENDPDDDNDGVPTASENADPNADGDPRDAKDSDRDGQSDYLDIEAGPSSTPIADEQKISASSGGLVGPLDGGDSFGGAVSAIGDIDGDDINDAIVGADGDDDGGTDRGAVMILFLNADGTVKAEQKISSTEGGFTGPLNNADLFGIGSAGIGDIDGDGVGDVAVGAFGDDDGGGSAGAAYVLFLNADGTVKAEQKISDLEGGLVETQAGEDRFGNALAGLGDLDGDGIGDLAIAKPRDDDGGTDRGAVMILFLNADGTVKAEQKISDTAGGFTGTLDDSDWFGLALDSLGDVDGDGIGDLAVGVRNDDDGGTNRGAVHILFLNADGTVKAEQKISDTTGGFSGTLDDDDLFGASVAGVGLLGGGTAGLVVGASGDDDGASDRGAVYLLTLNIDGTVNTEQKISSTDGGLAGPLDDADAFGASTAGLGDLDGDGELNLLISASGDDDGSSNGGAVYVLDLSPAATNSVPVANDDSATVIENQTTTIDVLANDTDADGDPLTVLEVIDGTNGTTADSGGSSVFYTPNPSYTGPDSFDYVVTDGASGVTNYWNLGGNASDSAGGDDGVINGTTSVTGATGDALSFDEIDDVVTFPDVTYGDDFTLSIDFKLDDITGSLFQYLYSHGDINTTNSVNVFVNEATHGTDPNVLRTVIRDGDDTLDNVALQFNIASLVGDGQWHTYTVNGDSSSGITVWLDGSVVATDPTRGTGTVDPAGSMYLGVRQDFPADRWFGGSIDTVLLSNASPSTTEVADRQAEVNRGTVNVTVIACADTDIDGLCDPNEDANTDTDDDPSTNPGPNTDGDGFANYFDPDDDNDTVPTAFENADPNGDGDPRDAKDSDRDGQPDYLDVEAGPSGTPVADEQKISSTQGGLTGPLDNSDRFGSSATPIGDLDGDGVVDVVVGAPSDDDGGANRGAAYILFLNADGTVKAEQKISDTSGGLSATLDDNDNFGEWVANIGDIDGDGIVDLTAGAPADDDGGTDRGSVYILFLNADGTVKAEQKISDTTGGFGSTLDNFDQFGFAVGGIGDIDADGINDIVVGAQDDDDGGSNRGSVYILFLNADGTVKAEQKISDTAGGLSATLQDSNYFGEAVAGIGDIDADGVDDIAVGSWADDDGGSNHGAVHILFLNTNGTVKAEQKISDTAGGLSATLAASDYFGGSVGAAGDVDGDGTNDLLVGAPGNDGDGLDRGAVHLVLLESDGTVKSDFEISEDAGGLTATLGDLDWVGISVAGLGDLDGDGATNIVVGASYDTDGGTDRGAVYILDLSALVDSDGDGLWDNEEDANTDSDFDPSTNPGPDTDGDTTPNYLDPDDDGDTTPTASESADPNGDGDPRDALDSDRDGQPDYLDIEAGPSTTPIADEQKISDLAGGLSATLNDNGDFGGAVSAIGDVDGDGVNDAVVGAGASNRGGAFRGAAYILFLNPDGTVKAEQEISSVAGGLTGPIDDNDSFAVGVAGIGDIDGDQVPDIAIGAYRDDDGGADYGAVYIVFLNSDGTVKAEQKISALQGSLTATLSAGGRFGISVTGLGDVDGDGINDIGVGEDFNDDGGANRGAAHVLFLNTDGTVKAEQKISDTTGGLTATLDNSDLFGRYVAGPGDINGDGTPDLAVNAAWDDDGGPNRGAVHVLFLNPDGTVDSEQKISDSAGGFAPALADSDTFGSGIGGVGDVDGDGTPDLAIGASGRDDGGSGRGAVYLVQLNTDGTVKDTDTLNSTSGGLAGPLDDGDGFGSDVHGLGDLDGDGTLNLLIGVRFDDDGGANRGAVYVLDLAPPVCPAVDSDGDGLWDCEEDANTDADGDPSTNPGPDTDGDTTPNYLDADDDGDTTPTASESADPNGDGDPRDAQDIDRDGQPDYLDAPITGVTDGTVKAEQKISDLAGGLSAALVDNERFGRSTSGIGDVDGDGVEDLVVGAPGNDDGGNERGAVYVLFMNADGTVKAEQKISDTTGGLSAPLSDFGQFGEAAAGAGDIDGDGVNDIVVGSRYDTDGGTNRGAVFVLFLNADGTVKAEQKISDTVGGLSAPLANNDWFGAAVAGIGDVDGDGLVDIAVGASGNDDGGTDRGAAYVLFLNADGTVKAEQKISDTTGGLSAVLADATYFGGSLAGMGDADGDGIVDLVVGASGSDDGGTDRGAAYVLFLNADGTVKAEQKISDTAGGLTATLADATYFGASVAGVGDADGDGIVDLVVGAPGDADGGTNHGAAYVLFLNADGTVKSEQKISDTAGGFSASMNDFDRFGMSVSSIGDLDGDGLLDLVIGTDADEDGGNNRGAMYIVNLAAPGCPAVDSDSDGLLDCEEDANTDLDGDPATNPGPDTDGDTLPNYLDPDDDGDGTPTASENADPNADGDSRDAQDTDRDGEPDYLDAPTVQSDPRAVQQTKISSTQGGLTGPLANSDQFGGAASSIGDVDGDGIADLAVGAHLDDDGAGGAGAVYVLFLNADGTVRTEQKISATSGGLTGPLEAVDYFGSGLGGVGDLDGDGINDIVVGASQDDDGGAERGAAYVLFLNADGTVKSEQKISDTTGGLSATLADDDGFGGSVAGIGDLDGDGINDVAIGATKDDDGGSNRGAVYVLFLNADGTVKAEQKISSTAGGLTGPLDNTDYFGISVAGIGDLDGDGINDIAAGAYFDDDGGTTRGAVYVLFMNTDGTVRAEQKISSTQGNAPQLEDGDWFGYSIGGIGDVDLDGTPDMVVGAMLDDDGASSAGAAYILLMNADGTVKFSQRLSAADGPSVLGVAAGDQFGTAATGLGDIDGDGTISFAVGARSDGDGGTSRGAVYVFDLPPLVDSDGDGLWDHWEDENADRDGDPATNAGPNTDANANPNYLDPDDDGDGELTSSAAEAADPNGDGDPRDAQDTDRDGEPDYLDAPTVATVADVATEQKISDTTGGLTAALADNQEIGRSLESVGDIDGDGIVDLAAGMWSDDDGGANRGAVYILFLNADGTVKSEQKISSTTGGLTAALDDDDQFGHGLASLGDVDGDGIPDLAVGAHRDDDGGADRGTVYVLFMNADGTVKAEQKISQTAGGLTATLDDGVHFGHGIEGIGDLDGDGIPDLAVGARNDVGLGASARGSVHILLLNADGTVQAEQKIGEGEGGFGATLADGDRFGMNIGAPGDIDGDGVFDMVVGSPGDNDGGNNRGAVYTLLLNTDGTVKGEQKISELAGGLGTTFANFDEFGAALSGIGDLDRDGTPDVLAGVRNGDDGGTSRGEVLVLLMNSDGTVKTTSVISDLSGGLATPLEDGDGFGASLAALGDLDGDGTIGLAAGATGDDDGGTNRGAIYILDLSEFVLDLVVNSTGDASDTTPGDGTCDTGALNSAGAAECTLRAAVEEANSSGPATVSFAMPATEGGHSAGVWTVSPATGYDDIVVPVTIDGSTQPGWATTPVVQLDGSALTSIDALRLDNGSSGSEIRSLAIGNFTDGNAVDILSDNNTVAANQFGVDAAGTTATPMGAAATIVVDGGSNNLIGGPTTGDRNVLAGADNGVVVMNGASDTQIFNNYIGVDVTGTADLSIVFDGVRVQSGSVRTTIGGTGAGNLIAGVGADGIEVDGETTDDTTISENTIGIAASDTTSLPVGRAININDGADDVVVDGNVIGNVNIAAIDIDGSSTNIEIRANVIGTDASMTNDHPVADGVVVSNGASDVRIGGTNPADANEIRNIEFGHVGVSIEDVSTDDIGVLGNIIDTDHGAIDLGGDGPTTNDAGDVDGGPNDLMNHPTLAVTNTTGAGPFSVDLDLILDAPAGDYRIEIYSNGEAGYGGGGKAQVLEHALTITHTGSGSETFTTSFTGSFTALSATATEDFGGGTFGSTSEMSPIDTTPISAIVNSTADTGDNDLNDGVCDTGGTNSEGATECTLRAAVEQTSRTTGSAVDFAIPASDPGYGVDGFWTISNGRTLDVYGSTTTIDGSSQPTFDGSRPLIYIDDRDDLGDTVRLRADDVELSWLSIGNPGDDGIQIEGDRALVDGLWVGIDPGGNPVGDTSASKEAVIVYDDSDAFTISNSRLTGFDTGFSSNSGTMTGTITGTEVFANQNQGVLFNNAGTISIVGNSIHDNGGLGFEFDADGIPLANDSGDTDTGPNDRLNTPVLSLSAIGAGTLDIDYDLDVPAGTYRVEFFDSARPDPTGFGEGETFLSAETVVHPGGNVTYSATISGAAGDVISATTTEDLGGGTYGATSEFSNALAVGVVFVNSTGESSDLALGDGNCDTSATNSDGHAECTLRAAMEEAVSNADIDAIHFQIPDTDPGFVAGSPGHWTIAPATTLPFSTDITSIDASTQPGWVDQPLIELDGNNVPSVGADGLHAADGMIVRGLSITRWLDDGAATSADNTAFSANWFGIAPDGTPRPNGESDLVIYFTSDGATVGGPLAEDGNVFAAGGTGDGLLVADDSTNVTVRNNFFGVAADGTTALGTATAELLSISDDTSDVIVNSNIFGNSPDAAVVLFANATNVTITGNTFGTDAGQMLSFPIGAAVYADTSGTATFGGTIPADWNTVRNAANQGLTVAASNTGSVAYLGNSVRDSTSLGIDLGSDGVTVNDTGDTDNGPNGLLNTPEISQAVETGGTVRISFGLDVPAGTYRIEAFTNPDGAHATGYGEGEVFQTAATVSHAGAGRQSYDLTFPGSIGDLVSLTTTQDLGGGTYGATSEFSRTVQATDPSLALTNDFSVRRSDVAGAGGVDVASDSAPGQAGTAVRFDGSNDRLLGPGVDITDGALSMYASFNADNLTGDPVILSKQTSAGNAIYELRVDTATSEVVAEVRTDSGPATASGGPITTGTWHQAIASWDGAELVLFVDGIEVDRVSLTGTLITDVTTDLTIGSDRSNTAPFDGLVDDVRISHEPTTIATAEALSQSQTAAGFVSVGGEQTAAPQPWTTSGTQTRSGSFALAAPETSGSGAAAWAVATGIDEPGLVFESWWWFSTNTGIDLSSGVRAGSAPTDQYEAALSSPAGWELRQRAGGSGSFDAPAGGTPASGAWVNVEIRTDQFGNSRVFIDGVEVTTSTPQGSALLSGSMALRAGLLPTGQTWYIDDARGRKLVMPEPIASVSSLDRN